MQQTGASWTSTFLSLYILTRCFNFLGKTCVQAAASVAKSSITWQGIELVNPSLRPGQETDQKSGTESYFSDYSGFRSIKRQKT
jgi:hypothetical protein